jgi:hypothetical protein
VDGLLKDTAHFQKAPQSSECDRSEHEFERGSIAQERSIALPESEPIEGSVNQTGSSIANLWLKVSQDDQPPASRPSTLSLENCPKCEQHLAPPRQATGQQVCVKCGWSNKPRNAELRRPESPASTDESELQRLLAQAASDSLENMKPRKKSL